MRKSSSRLVSVIGGLGYLSIIFQWVWLILLCMTWFLSLEGIKNLGTPSERSVTVATQAPPIVETAIAIVVTIVIIGVKLYIVSKLPGYVIKQSSHITHATRDIILPTITPDKKLSKRKERVISARLLLGTKIVFSAVAFLGLFGVVALQPPIDSKVIFAVGGYLFVWSIVLVILQRVIAHFKKN
ncbi:MAG: hypothetical protein WBB33_01530 [Candidatus Saccharimonadales bacterium]